ncbi:hypothetical protein [Mycolicibacterium mucogenicum]|uniref:hypothetical protein n=1 Tax=Mycolicibacterium mucogenicum TaxID=56689 RepID=UPI0013A58FB7|nr:hypothetical protein [Mycolicibacterium mucogenicum]
MTLNTNDPMALIRLGRAVLTAVVVAPAVVVALVAVVALGCDAIAEAGSAATPGDWGCSTAIAFGSLTGGTVGLSRTVCARTTFSGRMGPAGAVPRSDLPSSGFLLSTLGGSSAFLLRGECPADLRACASVAGCDLPVCDVDFCDVDFCDVVAPDVVVCDEGPAAPGWEPVASSANAGASGSHSARHPEASSTHACADNLVINRTLARVAARRGKMNKLVCMCH